MRHSSLVEASVGRAERGPGQTEITAEMARAAVQEVGGTDVRKETDADLGHRQSGAPGGDAVAMRWLPCSARPQPPPMITPSISALHGFGKRRIARLRAYSVRIDRMLSRELQRWAADAEVKVVVVRGGDDDAAARPDRQVPVGPLLHQGKSTTLRRWSRKSSRNSGRRRA